MNERGKYGKDKKRARGARKGVSTFEPQSTTKERDRFGLDVCHKSTSWGRVLGQKNWGGGEEFGGKAHKSECPSETLC